MKSGDIKNGMVAGFAGTAALSVLMIAKHNMGLMPAINTIADWQHLFALVTGTLPPPALGWVMYFLLGAVVWGIAYACLVSYLPGGPAVKGLIFGALAWVLMMVIFFPITGHGVLGLGFGLGLVPAVMTLILHLIYGLVLGLVYNSFSSGAAQADVVPN